MRIRLIALVTGFLVAGALAGCGGGNSSSTLPPPGPPAPTAAPTATPTATPAPTPTPIVIPSQAPFTATVQVPVTIPASAPGATPMPVPLPTGGGVTPTLLLPGALTATSAQVTAASTNVQPTDVIPLDLKRAALELRRTQARNGAIAITYISLFFTNTVNLATAPSFTFALPPIYLIPGVNYYVAAFDPTRASLGWQYAFEGPGTLSGSSVSFAANPAPFTFVGNLKYYFALIALPNATGNQPTPAPSVAPTTVPTQPPPPATQTAAPADAFVDSIGVNTHFGYTNSPYVTAYSTVKAALVGSGIRHFRDSVFTYSPAGYVSRLADLAGSGLRADLVTQLNTAPAVIAAYATAAPNLIEAIEGPNELDIFAPTNFASNLVAYQKVLYPAMSPQYPVVGPALTTASAYAAVGDLSAFMNAGSTRAYFAGRNPGTRGFGDNDPAFGVYGSIGYQLAIARQVSGSKPVIATETGYDDGATSPQNPPRAIVARYLQRALLELWNAGVPRTYIYELVDEAPGQAFGSIGLLDINAAPKPVYTAVKGLIAALADPGSAFTPSPLNLGISAATEVHRVLLQKRDGSYRLVLWVEDSAWNPQGGVETPVASRPATLSLASAPTSASAVTFDDSGNPVASTITQSGPVLTLSVTDRVTIVTIRP